ncbi:nickel-dependent lactate racemase [Desulfitibacter alkalitolerans]|uniref:nickel-dependent lactate racemase n=1 Tax=Desulfitibacter alkalitolerans TaxID=264641 RepID=UPI0004854FAD|nr:nickel-dependent lactate racemase [Desulfitibacter alkalitolerans]
MAEREFNLKYGKGTVTFSIPEEQILDVVLGADYPALENLEAAYLTALDHPIDAPPLKEIIKPGDTVAITVSDITRAWQKNYLTLPLLINYLNAAGVPDENITIVIAVGGHRANTEQECRELCCEEVYNRVKVVNHDAWDTKNMVYLGKTSRGTEVSVNRIFTEADKVILTGGIIYHYMVGYGGGRKSVLPGIASIKTIQQNHLWAMGPELGSGSNPRSASKYTRGNECHEDMMEIAAFVNPDFIVNVVPNPEGDIAGVFAGNWISAWLHGTELVDKMYGIEIQEEADIVIATAGGYPKDINLYQTGKTMDNAYYAMKKGGAAIILSECPDIMEPEEFTQWFNYESTYEMERALRANFTIPGWVAFKEVECSDKGPFILLTKPENAEFAKKAKLIPVTSIEDALKIAYEKCGTTNPKVTVMPQGANTFPIVKK